MAVSSSRGLWSENIQTGCEIQELESEAGEFCRKSLNGRRRNHVT
jgi:hypothetical protein